MIDHAQMMSHAFISYDYHSRTPRHCGPPYKEPEHRPVTARYFPSPVRLAAHQPRIFCTSRRKRWTLIRLNRTAILDMLNFRIGPTIGCYCDFDNLLNNLQIPTCPILKSHRVWAGWNLLGPTSPRQRNIERSCRDIERTRQELVLPKAVPSRCRWSLGISVRTCPLPLPSRPTKIQF